MKLRIKKLNFFLPSSPFEKSVKDLNQLSTDLDHLAKAAGTGNNKFRLAYDEVYEAISYKRPVENVVNSPVHVRALAMSLQSDIKNKISFTRQLLNKITTIVGKPSALLIESLYQHFLSEFDNLTDCNATAEWLFNAKQQRGYQSEHDHKILSLDGPKWIAKQAIERDVDFDHWLVEIGLEHYINGRYLTVAKSIYYVEQLKDIPLGSDHPLLQEIQKKSVYESLYDCNNLLGHKILTILISRSASSHISEAWLNVVLAIAGDPRVPSSHPRYIKWWKNIDSQLIQAVRGWLSRLDLKLFLEALEEFSYTPGNEKLSRMYPERKQFLEGLFNVGAILETRLFLSQGAARFLQRSYESKHLPNFKVIPDNDKSIIYVKMEQAHMVEGSHDCSLRIYKHLEPDESSLAYENKSPRYAQLTTGLYQSAKKQGYDMISPIPHSSSSSYIWQRKALTELRSLGVKLTPKDVLSQEDYLNFKQRYGVREWS